MTGTVATSARALRRHLVLLLAAMLAAVVAPAPPAAAASARITVTTTADELSEDGDCSLREALRAANRDVAYDACAAGRGADLIAIPPGVYRLGRGLSGEDEGRGGDLDILNDVTLRGAGADRTVIAATMRDRVLDVYGPGAVLVEGLTLRGGHAPEAPPDAVPEVGGCVRSNADLTLLDVRVEGCAAARGGGVASIGTASRLTLVRSVVSGSAARSEQGPGPAGGIGSEGELRLSDSTVMGNSGSLGAGIYSAGSASILRSTVAGNSAVAAVPLDRGLGLGAGIFNSGEMAIEASTISRNRAAGAGAGIFSTGGLSVADSTIAFNESFGPASPQGAAGLWAAGIATVRGSVLAGNREDGLPDDCAGVLSLGGNLFQVPCAPLDPSDRGGLDPLLGPLRQNGGHSLSHAPLEGSPAIDAGLLCGPADQRGLPRPQGVGCDIGAVEREEPRGPLAPRVRDEFAADGGLSASWAGPGRQGYHGEGGQLAPAPGGPVYWVRELLGQSQAAAVTLRTVDRSGPNIQGLLLKVRREPGRAGWRAGAIRVAADGAAGEVRIEVFAPGAGWRVARSFAAPLADGDVLGARAFADGTVAAYRNGVLLGTADTRDLPGVGELFVGRNGYAGLWFERAPGAVIDDFAAQ